MRGPVLALLLVASLLSGCLTLGPVEPAEELDAENDPIVTLAAPEVNPTGALGLYVPSGTTRLHIGWALGGGEVSTTAGGSLEEGRPKDQTHDDGPSGILGHFPDLFVLLGPDGERLFAGTPSLRLDGLGPETDGGNATSPPAQPKGTIHQTDAPVPGLYRLVAFGDIAFPHVTLEGPDARASLALLPLPVTVARTTLLASDGVPMGPVAADGEWTVPEGTVAVWGDLRGAGADTRMDITTRDDAVVAEVRRPMMADPSTAGVGQFVLGLDRIGSDSFSDPAAMDGRELRWSVTGLGAARAFAYAAVVGAMPEPLRMESADDDPARAVPLEGRLSSREAGGIMLPEGGRLIIHVAESSSGSRDHASFRVYDATGARLYTGSAVSETAGLALPAGPLAIVNDGPGGIEFSIVGTEPTDATLHELDVRIARSATGLGAPTGGSDTKDLRVVYGPLVGFTMSTYGTLEDIHIQVVREDGTIVAALPDTYPWPGGYQGCCWNTPFAYYSHPARWVDPGIHRLQVRAEGGQGEVQIEALQVDLDQLLSLVQDGN